MWGSELVWLVFGFASIVVANFPLLCDAGVSRPLEVYATTTLARNYLAPL